MRVHELAKEMDLTSKEMLEELEELGIDVANHMSTLLDEQVDYIRKELFGADYTPGDQASDESGEDSADEAAAADVVEAEPEEEENLRVVMVDGPIVVKEFAAQLGMKPNQLIAELMKMNMFASINEKLPLKIARRLAEKHDFELREPSKEVPKAPVAPAPVVEKTATPMETAVISQEAAEENADEPVVVPVQQEMPAAPKAKKEKKKKKKIKGHAEPLEHDEVTPPPIVTFLGHVDHGKTSLLDKIRNSRVASREDGGITQHIGAYTVEYNEHPITFLDTPGHAAFTAMRARGANLTNIAVLIVAADDGVMPQTREAIQHAQAAGVCILVAVNKCDLPAANPDRVLQQLMQAGLNPEPWGGDIGVVNVSAVTGEGLDELLERILLEAEMLELHVKGQGPANGYVIEAQMEQGRGPTASILVREGLLKVGDAILCGASWGRVKSLITDKGKAVRTAGPSTPVKCLGLTSVPEAGALVEVFASDKEARATAEARLKDNKEEELKPKNQTIMEWLGQAAGDEKQELNLVLKADVKGSLEAIAQSLMEINSEKVSLNFVLQGVGNISSNDVILASASNALVVGFHVGIDNEVMKTSKHEGVKIHLYSVIYELLDDVRAAMTGLLDPLTKETITGRAKVLQLFNIGKRHKVAGCVCISGRLVGSKAHGRMIRGGEVIYEGRIDSLKRFKNDASDVRESQECGIRVEGFDDYRPDDEIEFFTVEKFDQEL